MLEGVTKVTHAALAVIIVSLAAGCGGGADDATRATLSDAGCEYSGATTLDSGSFTVDVENETEYFGAFALASLSEGATIGSLQPFLAEAAKQFAATGTLPEPPSFYDQVARTGVEADEPGQLPVDVGPGTYALMCFVDDIPVWRAYGAAQLEIAE